MFRSCMFFIAAVLGGCKTFAQSDTTQHIDTLKYAQLQEVVVIGQRTLSARMNKPLATLEQYLEKANAVNMVRRGGYAWEPFLNGMASERSVITIDGMRIYAACTDKMDPVTSYVEITNLAKANVHSGQSGSLGGATIAGSLDLVRKKAHFGEKELKGTAFSGFETVNQQKIIGAGIDYSRPDFFANIDFTYRAADNYKAGGGKEVLYSQFTKYNMSAIAGYRIGEHQHLEASLIYDHAVDIGYPALTMDVASAKAFIGSVEYVRHHISPVVQKWQTKLYYNDVTHVMDDTKRPVVPVRMDMPGWSKTAGFYSILQGVPGKHNWKANLSGHHNKSLAEMTMYSNTPGESDMFMLTWPGVYTNYADLYAEDLYDISDKLRITVGMGSGIHNNQVNDQLGLESLQIFYPEMRKSKTRLLKRVSTTLQHNMDDWQYTAGLAYGERAPGVSEGYGFYLFNSFDRFDYIGNPEMRNEKSASVNGSVAYGKAGFSAKLSGSFFYIHDYIIGRPAPGLSVMTIGAAGVKVYEQLSYAHLFNTVLDLNYQLTDHFLLTNKLSYRRGTGAAVGNLPLIQPFTYMAGITYCVKSFSADAFANGAAKQTRFNPEFGEKALPAYAVFNLSASQRIQINKHSLQLKAGVENLADKNYTTFSDWNRIPRMGRNFFINVIWGF